MPGPRNCRASGVRRHAGPRCATCTTVYLAQGIGAISGAAIPVLLPRSPQRRQHDYRVALCFQIGLPAEPAKTPFPLGAPVPGSPDGATGMPAIRPNQTLPRPGCSSLGLTMRNTDTTGGLAVRPVLLRRGTLLGVTRVNIWLTGRGRQLIVDTMRSTTPTTAWRMRTTGRAQVVTGIPAILSGWLATP